MSSKMHLCIDKCNEFKLKEYAITHGTFISFLSNLKLDNVFHWFPADSYNPRITIHNDCRAYTWMYKSLEACAHELEGTIKQLCPRVHPRPRVTSRSQEILIAVYGHFASEIEGDHLDDHERTMQTFPWLWNAFFVSLSLFLFLFLSLFLSFTCLPIYSSMPSTVFFFFSFRYLLIFLLVLLRTIAQCILINTYLLIRTQISK